VQRADDLVAVRNAEVVFCCDEKARAIVTASWFRQMGYPRVSVLAGGTRAWREAGYALVSGAPEPEPFGMAAATENMPTRSPQEVEALLSAGRQTLIIFVDPSDQFAEAHLAGSCWLPRGWLELRIETTAPDKRTPIVVTDRRGPNAILSAATLQELGYANVVALKGGLDAWQRARLPVEHGLSGVAAPPDDCVPSGSDRSFANMIYYLRWEEALGKKYESDAPESLPC
jgi:rhodanese-related sulfurtransferase